MMSDELESRLTRYVTAQRDEQQPVSLDEILHRRIPTRSGRRIAIAFVASLAVAAGALLWVNDNSDSSERLDIVAGTSTTDIVPPSDLVTTTVAPHGVTTRLEVETTTVIQGEQIHGQIVVVNNTDSTIEVSGIEVSDGIYCAPALTAFLRNDEITNRGGQRDICLISRVEFPRGETRLPIIAITQHAMCTGNEVPDMPFPRCPDDGGPALLPPGEYELVVEGYFPPLPSPEPVRVRVVAPTIINDFMMYTHCGLNGAMVGDLWWEVRPSSDRGNDNPPSGWGNPFQIGKLTIFGDEAEFEAGEGRVVRLYRTELEQSPYACN